MRGKTLSYSKCDVRFTCSEKLELHVASVHESEKAHKCSICDSIFSWKKSMQRHVAAVHDGKKPFQCPVCSARLSTNQNLSKPFEKYMRVRDHSSAQDVIVILREMII